MQHVRTFSLEISIEKQKARNISPVGGGGGGSSKKTTIHPPQGCIHTSGLYRDWRVKRWQQYSIFRSCKSRGEQKESGLLTNIVQENKTNFPAFLAIDCIHESHLRDGVSLNPNWCSRQRDLLERTPIHCERQKLRVYSVLMERYQFVF